YMRAPSVKKDASKKREDDGVLEHATTQEAGVTLTRQSPLKVSTLVSVAPLRDVTNDFGVMARHEGDPVPHEHEFYRTSLQGLFSVDLRMSGRFYHINKTGFKHLDEIRLSLAKEQDLKEYDNGKAFELSLEERSLRIEKLLTGLMTINGGAKQAIHYTDVLPKFILLAVAKGGNHMFSTAIGADQKGLPKINVEAIKEMARVYKDEFISGIYVGLNRGYLDDQRPNIEEALQEISNNQEYGHRKTFIGHPKEAIEVFIEEMKKDRTIWLK
ncbi:MAG: type I-B CRISPR-associated protein Cas7/Cst2/DevR, partial [Desulfitobacterium hafniense]|nr:type I-B CRISPR-associated protein Cas7/Cst2/DevR [Desulfitobacterium hafniense]